jgi:hypothetical protein
MGGKKGSIRRQPIHSCAFVKDRRPSGESGITRHDDFPTARAGGGRVGPGAPPLPSLFPTYHDPFFFIFIFYFFILTRPDRDSEPKRARRRGGNTSSLAELKLEISSSAPFLVSALYFQIPTYVFCARHLRSNSVVSHANAGPAVFSCEVAEQGFTAREGGSPVDRQGNTRHPRP